MINEAHTPTFDELYAYEGKHVFCARRQCAMEFRLRLIFSSCWLAAWRTHSCGLRRHNPTFFLPETGLS